jgi:hypothetical protein
MFQDKPYKTRIKLLWTFVGITIVLVLGIWIITLHYRSMPENQSKQKFAPLIDSFQKLKEIIKK